MSASAETSPQFEVRRYAVTQGLSLCATVAGSADAPSVILLPGGGQTRHSWGRAVERLAQAGYHVISLDHRGHGDSDWSADGDYRLDTLVADVQAVMQTLSTRPALVGASVGGATALLAAGRDAGQRVAALVLVDIAPSVRPAGSAAILRFMSAAPEGFATLDEVADAVAAYNPHRPRPRDPAGLMKNLRVGADGRFYWHWDPAFIRDRGKGGELASLRQQMLEAAPEVRAPTLLVRGSASELVTPESIAELQALIPHAEVVDVSGAGHMVAGDRNDPFNAAILEFLGRRLPPHAARASDA